MLFGIHTQAAEIRGQNELRDGILATALFVSVPYLEGFRPPVVWLAGYRMAIGGEIVY